MHSQENATCRPDPLPELSDSDMIEYDTDVIALLHRPGTGEHSDDAELFLAKQRKAKGSSLQVGRCQAPSCSRPRPSLSRDLKAIMEYATCRLDPCYG